MITSLNQQVLIKLDQEIQKALNEVAARHGISIKSSGGGKFSTTNAELKVRISVVRNGQVLSAEEENFKRFCSSYGLKPEHLGRVFPLRGDSYTVIGLNVRNYKLPILAKNNTSGMIYKFTPQTILQKLNQIPEEDTDFDEPA